ncbi:MAG: hypothetical protein ABDH18_00460 [Aquificaceae bacterium]
MKLDLSNLLFYRQESQQILESLRKGIIEIILMELESLPRAEWEKTLTTWAKVFIFAKNLEDKQLAGLDAMSAGILHSINQKIKEAKAIGLLKEGDKPYKLIPLALENQKMSRDSAVYFLWKFFRRIS